jgi:hypothetical protein
MSERPTVSVIREWKEHPAKMVFDLFGVKPDPWQERVLEAFPHNQRLAMKACKGPGKTALLTWLAWNFLLTRPFPKIAATSISADNLSDNLWTEMAKWQNNSPLLKDMFAWNKTRIAHKEEPETWYMTARTWPKAADKDRQADTLAGLHADYIMFLLDESGGIPDAVMATAEAALSSCVEGHIVQAGNPTQLDGPLYRASTNERHLWHVTEITGDPDDPMRSPRISVQWAREQIEKYGRDNPWVLVNVFGQFPPSSLNALIGIEELQLATKRYYREYEIGKASKILGVDVARFGDDKSIICKRQGIQTFPFEEYRNLDSTMGASKTAEQWDSFDADACFIDDTGGFGAGWIDQLRNLGRTPIGVGFATKASNDSRYANKRAEMYFEAVEWIKRGGAIPDSRELIQALSQTTYTFQKDRLLLEPKDEIKTKLGFSPDHADAFVLTFAFPVSPKSRNRARNRHKYDYDPFDGKD